MAAKDTRTLRIHRREDGKFVTRNETATDSALGVDPSVAIAAGSPRSHDDQQS